MLGTRLRLKRILRYAGLLLCFALGFLAGLGGTALAAAPQQGGGANYALQFDGLDDRVDLSAATLGQPASLTVEAWVRIDAPNKIHYLVTNADSDFNDGFSLVVDQNGRVNFAVASALFVKGIALSATQLELGRWYHVAGVYDAQGGAVKVCVDGVEEGVVAYSGGIRYLSGRGLKFGTQNKSFNRVGRYLQGAVDEVRIWEVARNPDDVAANMNLEITGREQGLKGYWQLNEGTGISAEDAASGSNSGQLKMGPEWIEASWRAVSEQQIAIDVKPGGSHNVVMLNRGKIPVALLSSASLDVVADVDRTTLTFGRNGTELSLDMRGRLERPNCGPDDVNHDGLPDLVCKFETKETNFQPGDTEAILRGMTTGGVALMGTDDIIVKGRKAQSDRGRRQHYAVRH